MEKSGDNGLLLYPPLGETLMGQIGWRNRWIVCGLLMWVVLAPVGLFL